MRRATAAVVYALDVVLFLSTLSLRRATDSAQLLRQLPVISIHALLAESDPAQNYILGVYIVFLSTLSLRRATKSNKLAGQKLVFLSTLSLRRATPPFATLSNGKAYFYPRSPCGERRAKSSEHYYNHRISIHALLAESDVEKVPADVFYQAFLSTLSLRRATGNG